MEVEPQEVGRLYDAYSQDIYRLALTYLRSTQDAEDICHSVFLALVEKDVTLFPGKEKAWLLKCTANACKNHLKSFWKQNQEELNENKKYSLRSTIWKCIDGKWKMFFHQGTYAPKFDI